MYKIICLSSSKCVFFHRWAEHVFFTKLWNPKMPCFNWIQCDKNTLLTLKNNTIIALERELVCLTLFFGSKHQKNDTWVYTILRKRKVCQYVCVKNSLYAFEYLKIYGHIYVASSDTNFISVRYAKQATRFFFFLFLIHISLMSVDVWLSRIDL